ncbi:hypothetical protein ACFP59_10980, partial [Microbacterium koreense]
MTIPSGTAADRPASSSLIRAAIWVAIGALIAAAVVCVIWVFVGSAGGMIGRAFLTILLLVAFAGVAILDAHLAPRRPAWFSLASIGSWVVLLLIGAVMIWMPERSPFSGVGRFLQFLIIVLIVQLALLHIRLYMKAFRRYVTPFTQAVTIITIALVVALTALLVLPLMLWEYVTFADIYWRFVVAAAILAAVGTMLVPLVNVLFAPKKPVAARPGSDASAPQPAPWPTYVDGMTPLPVMPDGSPDWGAYYSGYPSPGAYVVAPVAAYPADPYAAHQPHAVEATYAPVAASAPAAEPAPEPPHPAQDPAAPPVDAAQEAASAEVPEVEAEAEPEAEAEAPTAAEAAQANPPRAQGY